MIVAVWRVIFVIFVIDLQSQNFPTHKNYGPPCMLLSTIAEIQKSQGLGSAWVYNACKWLAGLVSRVCMAGLVFRVCMGVHVFRWSKYHMTVLQSSIGLARVSRRSLGEARLQDLPKS